MAREARRETRRVFYHRRQAVQEIQQSLPLPGETGEYANTDQDRAGGGRLDIPWPLRRCERMGSEQGRAALGSQWEEFFTDDFSLCAEGSWPFGGEQVGSGPWLKQQDCQAS